MNKVLASLIFLIPLSACVALPSQPTYDKAIWLDQGWNDDERHWYHHASQGTNTFKIPYEFFVELEQPIGAGNWYKGLAGKDNKFSDPKYLSKFGFIPSKKSGGNPDDLPVGFAKTVGFGKRDANTGLSYVEPLNTIGLTCAGCHTGQLTYKNTVVRIDGAPAVTNLAELTPALDIAMAETVVLPTRAARFKKAVIGRILRENPGVSKQHAAGVVKKVYDGISTRVKAKIKAKALKGRGKAAEENTSSAKEGFTRLDALNGIGNAVFGKFDEANKVARNAPVSYPQIWSASWFDWVQYDASIMQPLVRNVGEAMGLGADVQLPPKPAESQFASTVDFDNLIKMEEMLAGKTHPQQGKAFTGLKAPAWPASVLGNIDQGKRADGEKLYNELCVGCHRPPVKSAEFWSDEYWSPIKDSKANYYKVVLKSVKDIGTDAAQSEVLASRKVDLTGMGDKMNGTVCSEANGQWGEATVKAGPDQSFAFALGLIVERTIHQASTDYDKSDRPNCLRAPRGYKARPLNGIWATAPFLHNGSIANLYDLLSPVSERAKVLYLGYQEFDPVNVGYVSTVEIAKGRGIDLIGNKGLSKVVVGGAGAVLGNKNTGHEFSDKPEAGVIGRGLTVAERRQLIEFLKSL